MKGTDDGSHECFHNSRASLPLPFGARCFPETWRPHPSNGGQVGDPRSRSLRSFHTRAPPPRPQENLRHEVRGPEQIRRGEAEPVRKARHVFPATGRLAQGCGDLPKQSIGTSSSRELRASQGQAGQARAEGAPASASRPQRTSASKRPASERRLGKQEPILGLTFPGCSLAQRSFR